MQGLILCSMGEEEWEGCAGQYPCYKGAHTLVGKVG